MRDGPLYEFRDYHYDGDLEEYRGWWDVALPVLEERIDVVGVWFDSGVPPRVSGSQPMEMPHGSPNVTWIIRWADLEERERWWEALWDDAEWQDAWERHPGFEHYLQMSVRFLQPS